MGKRKMAAKRNTKISKKNETVKPGKISQVGYPSQYNEKIAEKILHAVRNLPHGLPKICKMNPDFPCHQTIAEWRRDYPEFGDKFLKAKEEQAHVLFDSCLDEAENEERDVNRSRLIVTTRQWQAARLKPRKYGDSKALEDVAESNESLKEEVAKLRKELQEKYKKDY